MGRFTLLAAGAFAGGLSLSACGEQSSNEALTAEAEAAIKAELLDPTSALFTEVTVDGAAVCGLVNGKNRFGGYVGAKRFVWVKGGTAQIEPSTVGLSANASGATTCMFDSIYGDCKGDAGAPTVTECSSGLLRR